jgi:quinol monooxygenase YgiN
MIHVVAVITAQPGKLDDLLAAFRENAPVVREEEGCIQYIGAVDAEGFGRFQAPVGPDTFVVLEKWASTDALKAHGAAPHMVAYAAKTKDLTAARAIHILAEA